MVREIIVFNDKNLDSFLDQFNYDIRISGNARWIDQKCTPDVVCIIADCIINLRESEPNKEFTVQDIWDSQYFIKNVKAIFNKPSATNPTTRSEYDKFIQQPLRLLAYAHVLHIEKKGNKNFALLQLIKVIPKLREFLTFWVGDSIAYTAENDNGIRSKVWRTLSTEILKMQPDDKYSIIAHSLGSVIAFDYLFKLFIKDTLLHPGEFPETDSKILDNYKNKFCHFFTMGSPISLFLLRQGKLYQKKSGNFLIQKETKNFDNLISPVLIDKNLPIEFNRTWFNFCDTEDILSLIHISEPTRPY